MSPVRPRLYTAADLDQIVRAPGPIEAEQPGEVGLNSNSLTKGKGTMPSRHGISLSFQFHATSGAFRHLSPAGAFVSTDLMSEPFDDTPKNGIGQ